MKKHRVTPIVNQTTYSLSLGRANRTLTSKLSLEEFVALFARYRHVTSDNRDYIITDANSKDNTHKGSPLDVKAEDVT